MPHGGHHSSTHHRSSHHSHSHHSSFKSHSSSSRIRLSSSKSRINYSNNMGSSQLGDKIGKIAKIVFIVITAILVVYIFSISGKVKKIDDPINFTDSRRVYSDTKVTEKYEVKGDFEFYHTYFIDNAEIMKSRLQLEEGLKYFFEKTNIQMVVVTSNASFSDQKAIDKYNEIFDDESHILIIIPKSADTQYYAIGDDIYDRIDESILDDLLDNINDYCDGNAWKEALISWTDSIS